ncbi:glycosyltransferase family 2 protein [Pontibacter sp. JAM-7]|uniref:glycosyltransferase family 2 protein n=1 Tax=Pontibacter sp. JAM-7 TaxID=3366581 RepID=UPI003AF526B9
MVDICICVCTCQRGELLKTCLASLAAVSVQGFQLSVLIVDNDADRSAESLVNGFNESFPFPLRYVCEAKRGIPCARNRAVEDVLQQGSDYLVFIDDDEWVEPDWLLKLFQLCQENSGEVVVSGGVMSELPTETPPEIRALFNKRLNSHARGKRLESCATNNVLVPMAAIKQHSLRFDESRPLAGGTDVIFFKEATAKGVRILKCPDALVHEIIPVSRTRLGWLSKRKYRAGITEAWRKKKNGRAVFGIFVSALFQIVVLCCKAGVSALFGRKVARNQSWLKACRALGVAAGVFGVEVDSYRQIDG